MPCVVNAQGLVDLALIGGIKNESLPNITGATSLITAVDDIFDYGAFYKDSVNKKAGIYGQSSGTNSVNAFDASRSSSTYQDNAPVQQEAIQYPYCIVVNTGVEETDRPINNYQVNNVYSYGMSQYYNGTMNNNSWLKSAGQWNDGTVYTGMYNWLLEQMNAGVSGFVASTAAYTDYDFVINTENQTFRLPLLNGEEDWVGNETSVLSTADIVKDSPFQWTATKNGFVTFTCYANKQQVVIARINNQIINHTGAGVPATVTPRPGFWLKVKKGDIVSLAAENETLQHVEVSFIPAVGNGTLYYYIGDTLQNAQLINVARIEETLVNKADTDLSNCTKPYVTETYRNGTEWYRVWSDGWIEQGGAMSGSGSTTVTLLKGFSDTTYTVQSTCLDSETTNFYASFIQSKSTNSFVAFIPRGSLMWQSCGY